MIIAESRRLERLVGDLLDLTKLEAQQMSIALRPTDVAEVVATTAEGFRPAAAKSGLAVVLRVPDGDGHGRADRASHHRWSQTPTDWPSCWPTCWRTPSRSPAPPSRWGWPDDGVGTVRHHG